MNPTFIHILNLGSNVDADFLCAILIILHYFLNSEGEEGKVHIPYLEHA